MLVDAVLLVFLLTSLLGSCFAIVFCMCCDCVLNVFLNI